MNHLSKSVLSVIYFNQCLWKTFSWVFWRLSLLVIFVNYFCLQCWLVNTSTILMASNWWLGFSLQKAYKSKKFAAKFFKKQVFWSLHPNAGWVFYSQKTAFSTENDISTSVWHVQHPNAGWNKQHFSHYTSPSLIKNIAEMAKWNTQKFIWKLNNIITKFYHSSSRHSSMVSMDLLPGWFWVQIRAREIIILKNKVNVNYSNLDIIIVFVYKLTGLVFCSLMLIIRYKFTTKVLSYWEINAQYPVETTYNK